MNEFMKTFGLLFIFLSANGMYAMEENSPHTPSDKILNMKEISCDASNGDENAKQVIKVVNTVIRPDTSKFAAVLANYMKNKNTNQKSNK